MPWQADDLGTRIWVGLILGLLAGITVEDILADYPALTEEDSVRAWRTVPA